MLPNCDKGVAPVPFVHILQEATPNKKGKTYLWLVGNGGMGYSYSY